MPIIKLVMLGSGGVGKSAISMRFIQNTFVTDYDPTIENSYRKQISLDTQDVMLEVLDTAGQEEYAAMRDSQIREGMGFALVYSITSPESFSEMTHFRKRILLVKDRDSYPSIILGNKVDLEKDRKVSTKEGSDLAKEFDVPFLECSAKASINITNAYEELARMVLIAHEKGLYEEEGNGAFFPSQKKKGKACLIS